MGRDPRRSDEFLRLLVGLAEADDESAGEPFSDAAGTHRSPGFVPWPDALEDRSSGNISQWLDRLGWIDASDNEAAHPGRPTPDAPDISEPAADEVVRAAVLRELDCIAAELGEDTYRSATAVALVRRIYAARHHPDLAPPPRRAIATRCMMIANTMIDAALQKANRI